MDYQQMLIEYILVYCTSHGLTSIGEPALPKTYQPVGESLQQCSRANIDPNADCRQAMPVWIISIFLLLATFKWMASFFIWYLYLVLSTVTAVASTPINPLAALNATGHEDSHRARLLHLTRAIKVLGAFKISHKPAPPLRTGSVLETRQELTRRATNPSPLPAPLSRRHTAARPNTFWHRLTSHPAFRGLSAYLTLQIPQWYLGHIIDVFLSGLPADHTPGYGATSIVLATAFGGGAAVWTHYCITQPSHNKPILSHFPRGHQVLTELWPVTAFWAVCEHLTLSVPLALSRWLGLRALAFDAEAWNGLAPEAQRAWLGGFAGVWAVHVILVVAVGLPAMIVARRFYASMMSEGDFAIVPFYRRGPRREQEERVRREERERARREGGAIANAVGGYRFEDESKLRKPGLTVSEAWGTLSWAQYMRVLAVYVAWVVVNQGVQLGYWWANWQLHQGLGVTRFSDSTKLPCSPVGVLEPVLFNNITFGGFGVVGGGWINGARSEL